VSFERTIALQNVADLDPPRWAKVVLATHPSTAERIGAALSYAKTHSPRAAAAATANQSRVGYS
jgi:STE24 endopeptidase